MVGDQGYRAENIVTTKKAQEEERALGGMFKEQNLETRKKKTWAHENN